MTPADMRAVGARFIEEIINQGKLSVLDEALAQEFVDHSLPPGLPADREGQKMLLAGLRTAFPDIHYSIDKDFVDGDHLVHYVTATGTMTGPFMGVQPTGKRATWSEARIVRFAGDKVVEHWAVVDQLGMLVQLGSSTTPRRRLRREGPGAVRTAWLDGDGQPPAATPSSRGDCRSRRPV
jgi:predicted ester cyclase